VNYYITFSLAREVGDTELHQVTVFRDLSSQLHLRSDRAIAV
jgi:hypothetical protein